MKYATLTVLLMICALFIGCAGSQKATKTFLAVDDAVHDLKERYVVYFTSATPEQQQQLREKVLPIWESIYDALDAWQIALEAEDFHGMQAHEAEFMRLKNQLLNRLYEIIERRISNVTDTDFIAGTSWNRLALSCG